jgi:glutathione reductase (NADPH)
VEIANVLTSFGVKCTSCMLEPTVVPPFDEEITRMEMEVMTKRGITLNPECKVKSVEKLENGRFKISMEGAEPVEADAVLNAMGNSNNHISNLSMF